MKVKHRLSAILVFAIIAVLCVIAAATLSACGVKAHDHVYSEDWEYDETYHWHYCTVYKKCDAQDSVAEHTYDYTHYTTDDNGNYVYSCTACGYQTTETKAIYSITLTNIGGTPLTGVDIELRTSAGVKVSSGTTNSSGILRFRDLDSGTYIAYIDESTLPAGYSLDDNAITMTATDKNITVIANASILTDEMPSSTVYSVGDIIYDFTVTCYDTDGSSYQVTLSDYLEKYNAVVINFFYTTCSPCISEVPYMQQAYEEYAGKIGLIAFDYTGAATTDTVERMINFKSSYGLTFDFTLDSGKYYNNYGVIGFPTTVIVDRYGIIAEIETGSNVSASSWLNMFEYYISDDYEPSYTTTKRDDTTSSQVESDVEMPSSEEIAAAIVTTNSYTTSTSFTFSNYTEDGVVDTYNWPWIIGEEEISGVSNYIQTSNYHIVGGYSIIVIDVTLKAGQAVLFDYLLSTEEDYDIFYVQVDTVLQLETSGSSSWQTCLAYMALYDGDYQITLYYQKDSSKNIDNDTVYVSNLRIGTAADIAADTSISVDLLYNAATNYASSSVDVSAYGEDYGYYNYVDVYLASDGYYHVGSKTDGSDPGDDPYLLADIYYGTPWYSSMSVWYEVYAFADEIDEKLGSGTYDAFEDYAWVQNNCPWNYIPVNEELHDMLVAFVDEYGRTTGDLLENQWLELCRYYVHYGSDHDDGDKCYSVENIAETYGMRYAKDLGTISADTYTNNDTAYVFTAEMETILVPRGNYYSFTVDKSGVYRVYSYDFLTDADAAPYAFISGSGVSASSEQDDLANEEGFQRTGYDSSVVSYDFGMYVYLTAGETYYLGCTFASTEETGTYRVGIYYIGDELRYLATLATGSVYTYYEVTDADGNVTNYVYYLPTRLSRTSYALIDGYWYTTDSNGNPDQLIYIDMIGSTWWNYYSSYTIEEAIEANAGDWNAATLAKLKNYITEAKSNTGTVDVTAGTSSLYGLLPASADLVSYVNQLCNGGDDETSSTYAENAWMLTAYYVRVVN